jgi:hypothetical protein
VCSEREILSAEAAVKPDIYPKLSKELRTIDLLNREVEQVEEE